jgi:integrase/recombinase XerD
MFETLFRYPAIIARHRDGPFAEDRERFLEYRSSQGLASTTLQQIAQELLAVAERIEVTNGPHVSFAAIEKAAELWVRQQLQRKRAHETRWSRQQFMRTALDWLRFLGRLEIPTLKAVPFADRLVTFAAYQRDERGLSPNTIRNQNWQLEKFLLWLNERNRTLADVSLEDVDIFLAEKGNAGWCRVSVAASAKALRAFFCYATTQGWCARSIADGIDGPRLFQHEGLPVGPSWLDVQRLIASTIGDSAQDVRDRAILILLATYGLRSGEVTDLRFEDVNWETETLSIRRSKQRRVQEYPLVSIAGEAILRYLQCARPRCKQRQLFLTLRAPNRQLSQGALYDMVRKRLDALDIQVPRRGPHSLRHACAGHLVTEGFSLKEIGDHLGHSSAFVTRVYAKVDLAGLREVADFDLGGLR